MSYLVNNLFQVLVSNFEHYNIKLAKKIFQVPIELPVDYSSTSFHQGNGKGSKLENLRRIRWFRLLD